MKERKVIHACRHVSVANGKFVHLVDDREVTLMATAGNYAMVRRKGACPYVAALKEIREIETKP